ncbi:MAG: ribonuclease P, partial [Candidatus Aenigmatarchaeota archaeon]
ARKIGLRYNIRFPKDLKRKFCKNCNSLLIPGFSSKIKIKNKVLEIKCLNCDKIYQYPFKKVK